MLTKRITRRAILSYYQGIPPIFPARYGSLTWGFGSSGGLMGGIGFVVFLFLSLISREEDLGIRVLGIVVALLGLLVSYPLFMWVGTWVAQIIVLPFRLLGYLWRLIPEGEELPSQEMQPTMEKEVEEIPPWAMDYPPSKQKREYNLSQMDSASYEIVDDDGQAPEGFVKNKR